jgi:hypothetical protein
MTVKPEYIATTIPSRRQSGASSISLEMSYSAAIYVTSNMDESQCIEVFSLPFNLL